MPLLVLHSLMSSRPRRHAIRDMGNSIASVVMPCGVVRCMVNMVMVMRMMTMMFSVDNYSYSSFPSNSPWSQNILYVAWLR